SITLTFEFARIKLLDFNIPFKRPSFMGTLQGGVLTLAIGPNAHNRLQGDVTDISETIHARSSGGAGGIDVWSDQFNRDSGNAQHFDGVTKIVADGGQGDDTIDLAGVSDGTVGVEVHGGDGNDTITGPAHSAVDANGVAAKLSGDAGVDHLNSSSDQTDLLDGGDGGDFLDSGPSNSILQGGPGDDTLTGHAGHVTLDGGPGNDTIVGGGNAATKFLGLDVASVVVVSGTPILDFTGRPENIV